MIHRLQIVHFGKIVAYPEVDWRDWLENREAIVREMKSQAKAAGYANVVVENWNPAKNFMNIVVKH